MKKRVLILAVISIAIMTMVACGKKQTEATKAPIATNTQAPTASETPVPGNSTELPAEISPEAGTEPTPSEWAEPTDTPTPTSIWIDINKSYGLGVDIGSPTAAQIETQRKANKLMQEKLDGKLKNYFEFVDLNHDGIYEYYVKMDQGKKDSSTFNDLFMYVEDEKGEGHLQSMTNTQYGLVTFGFDKKRTLLIQEYTTADSYIKYVYYFVDMYGDEAYLPKPFNGQSKVYADFTVGVYTIVNDDGSKKEIDAKSDEGRAITQTISEFLGKENHIPDLTFAGTQSNCDVYLPLDDHGIIGWWTSRTRWN